MTAGPAQRIDDCWFTAESAVALGLLDELDLKPWTSAIDVGTGAGTFVDGLLDRGFSDVSALDWSAEAVQSARARLGPRADAVAWICRDLLHWQSPRRYTLWHDRGLLHLLIEDSAVAHYLRALQTALSPGGYLLLGTYAPDGPDDCGGAPVRRYDIEALAAVLGTQYESVSQEVETRFNTCGEEEVLTWALFRQRTGRRGPEVFTCPHPAGVPGAPVSSRTCPRPRTARRSHAAKPGGTSSALVGGHDRQEYLRTWTGVPTVSSSGSKSKVPAVLERAHDASPAEWCASPARS